MVENELSGRPPHWFFLPLMLRFYRLSVSNDLRFDAIRDLRDIHAQNIDVYWLNKFHYKLPIKAKKGVIFANYSSLIGESRTTNEDIEKTNKFRSRLKQIIQWFGKVRDLSQ